MKRLIVGMLVVAIVAALALSGCSKTPEPTQQEVVDRVIAETSLADYTFDRTYSLSGSLAAQSDESASCYILCHQEGQEDEVVYCYRDNCYDESKNYRYFDIYTPAPLSRLDPNTPVFVYLHGGGWFFGDRRTEGTSLMPYMAKAGFVVISMEYALLCGLNQLPQYEKGLFPNDSNVLMEQLIDPEIPVCVSDIMNDVRTLLGSLQNHYFPAWGLTATKVGIGGYSAGGHLSSLYAYKYNDAPLKAGFLMSLVGPVSLLEPGYLRVLEKLTKPLLPKCANTLAYVLESPVPLDVTTEEGYQATMEYIHKVQPVDYITPNSLPTILCYAGWDGSDRDYSEELDPRAKKDPLNFEEASDSLVPVSVYNTIVAKLQQNNVVFTGKLWQDKTHTTAGTSTDTCKWMALNAKAYAKIYLGNN